MATISKSVTVADGGTYTLELNAIPTGSTVTPVNDIQTWLHCADIWNKTYTDIAQVLADTSTLQALIASNNAVNYMARSTTWASSVTANSNAMVYIGANNYCANKLLANNTWLDAICNSAYFESVLNVKVPTMTGNTTPYGETISSGNYKSYYPYLAFDGTNSSESDSWLQSGNGANSAFIGYKFLTPVCINMVYMQNRNDASPWAIKDFAIQGSNDRTNWEDIATLSNSKTVSSAASTFAFENSNSYLYYRLFVKSVYYTNYVGVGLLQFYGRA